MATIARLVALSFLAVACSSEPPTDGGEPEPIRLIEFASLNGAAVQLEPSGDESAVAKTFSTVARIIDGDTLVLDTLVGEERVRLLGLDAPELDGEECHATEAARALEALVVGRQVEVVPDATQDTRDRYDRLLAYLYREDGLFVNLALVAGGHAKTYV